VSWFEAVKYTEWLSLVSGKHYRLPSEAEWERAARAGREGALYIWGDEPPQEHPAYVRRWGGDVKATRPAGEGEANEWGFYELGENVHEWCADWFQKDYYAVSPERNPRGPDAGERRASRGGSWRHHVKVFRRIFNTPITDFAWRAKWVELRLAQARALGFREKTAPGQIGRFRFPRPRWFRRIIFPPRPRTRSRFDQPHQFRRVQPPRSAPGFVRIKRGSRVSGTKQEFEILFQVQVAERPRGFRKIRCTVRDSAQVGAHG
jgi:hypothetical protein